MPSYNREFYSLTFARLLNKAMKRGDGDPRQALKWLDRRYKPLIALLFSRHRLETTDAYMDVREHIVKRVRALESNDRPEVEGID